MPLTRYSGEHGDNHWPPNLGIDFRNYSSSSSTSFSSSPSTTDTWTSNTTIFPEGPWMEAALAVLSIFLQECHIQHQCDGTEWNVVPTSGLCDECPICYCMTVCYTNGYGCCLDRILYDVRDDLMQKTPKCHNVFLTDSPQPSYYIMEDSCKGKDGEGWDDEKKDNLNTLCVNGSADGGVEDRWPVSSVVSGVTYRNRYCARCHGEAEDMLLRWDVSMFCTSGTRLDTTSNSTLQHILQQVLNAPGCHLSFYPPKQPSAEQCLPKSLPKSKACTASASLTNQSKDSVFTSTCTAFHTPDIITPLLTDAMLFCALCHFRRLESCNLIKIDLPFPFIVLVSSSALEDVTGAARVSMKSRCRCADDEIYDKYESRCRKLHCIQARKVDQGQCQLVVTQVQGQGYELSLRLTPLVSSQSVQVDGPDLLDAGKQILNKIKDDILMFKDFQIDRFWIIAHSHKNESRNWKSSRQPISVTSFDLNLQIVNRILTDVQGLEQRLLDLQASVLNFSLDPEIQPWTLFQASPLYFLEPEGKNDTLEIQLVPSDGENDDYFIDVTNYIYKYWMVDPTELISVDEYLSVQYTLNCTKTAFRLSTNYTAANGKIREQHGEVLNKKGGNLDTSNQTVESSHVRHSLSPETEEVILTFDLDTGAALHVPSGQRVSHHYVEFLQHEDVVMVCVDQLFPTNSSPSPFPLVLERLFSSHLIWLSVACQTLSVVGLFLVLLTYCLFVELRTLPGKNTMGLVASLFLTMLLFELGVARVELPTLCTIVGVAIHFFLLSSFTWMAICSVNMYRVFTHVLNARSGQLIGDSALFLKHTVLSLLIPSLVVTLTLMGNWVAHLQDNHDDEANERCGGDLDLGLDLGYGRGICYVSNTWSLVLGSVAPICLVVVVNLVLFLATLRALRSVSEEMKSATKQHRQHLAVYARIASLTGINWMAGIMTAAIDSVVLWYIFIPLCGLQGLYIFLAFVCNRRVLSLYRALLCGRPKEERKWKRTDTGGQTSSSFENKVSSDAVPNAVPPFTSNSID